MCLYTDDREIDMQSRVAERRYFYRALHQILMDSVIEPVAPLHQASMQPGETPKGYCHGFCLVWAASVSHEAPLITGMDWDNLQYGEDIAWCLTLNAQVIRFQKDQHKKFRGAFYKGQHTLAQGLYQYFKAKELHSGCLYTVDIGRFPGVCNRFFRAYPHVVRDWHEVCLHVDVNGFIHWFDPNLGWFKSKDSHPNVQAFFVALEPIFTLLEYDIRYQCLCVREMDREELTQVHQLANAPMNTTGVFLNK